MDNSIRCINNIGQIVDCGGWEWWQWLLIIAVTFTIILIAWELIGYPRWKVWAAHQDGLADLANARNEQQVQVAQAQGRLDAAELNKKAAIVEAEAVAAQIQTIGDNLKQHDLYLRWQWIKMMEETEQHNTIYVPTEAGLPILEAGKRS